MQQSIKRMLHTSLVLQTRYISNFLVLLLNEVLAIMSCQTGNLVFETLNAVIYSFSGLNDQLTI